MLSQNKRHNKNIHFNNLHKHISVFACLFCLFYGLGRLTHNTMYVTLCSVFVKYNINMENLKEKKRVKAQNHYVGGGGGWGATYSVVFNTLVARYLFVCQHSNVTVSTWP